MVTTPALTIQYLDPNSRYASWTPTLSVSKAASPYPFLPSVARSSILSVLQNASLVGRLQIDDCDGSTWIFGEERKGGNMVYLRILDASFWTRLFLYGDLGFSEAYMAGEVEVDGLKGIMDFWLENESNFSGLSSFFAKLVAGVTSLRNAFFGQTRGRARLNVMASYDQSNELFKAFLSEEMMYSCALWGEEEHGVRGDLTHGPTDGDLEAAQKRKIHHVLRAARVKPGQRILEIGSGWGGLAIEAARCYGCEVDTLTLSVEQKTLAEERIAEAGLSARVRVHLLDYRDIPTSWQHAFDAFVSIEMLEHVGSRYYKKYFEIVDFALKRHDASVVVTCTTFPEGRYTGYQADDFMRVYMWPNSCLASATVLIDAAFAGSHGRLTLESVENHAPHYPRTLRTWDRRLKANLRQDAMAREYPALRERAVYDAFLRKWEYLFAYAGAGFAKGYITCHMLSFVRPSDVAIACA